LDYASILIAFAVVLLSLTVHEAAHAVTADRLGDPTARLLGRVSLNPAVHIDLFGTIILPLLAALSHLPIIGWAKPVPVNINRLRQPRRDFILVAAAGPASNLVLATLAAVLFRLTSPGLPFEFYFRGSGPIVPQLLFYLVEINVLLAVFNMIPVPPLDGGNVLAGLLPPRAADEFARLRPYGFLLLYALMFSGILTAMITPPSTFLMGLLLK
jgi:Zn-dependent protease